MDFLLSQQLFRMKSRLGKKVSRIQYDDINAKINWSILTSSPEVLSHIRYGSYHSPTETFRTLRTVRQWFTTFSRTGRQIRRQLLRADFSIKHNEPCQRVPARCIGPPDHLHTALYACFWPLRYPLCDFWTISAQAVTQNCILMPKPISLEQVWAESRPSCLGTPTGFYVEPQILHWVPPRLTKQELW